MGQVLLREEQFKIADRTWLMMAFIGVVLADHPVIKRNKKCRRLVDQARAALFELYCLLDPGGESMLDAPRRKASARADHRNPIEDDFGEHLLRRKGSIPPDVALELEPRREGFEEHKHGKTLKSHRSVAPRKQMHKARKRHERQRTSR